MKKAMAAASLLSAALLLASAACPAHAADEDSTFVYESEDAKVTATVSAPWKKEVATGSTRDELLLGSWSLPNRGGILYVRRISHPITSIEEYARRQPSVHSGDLYLPVVRPREWAVIELNNSHTQLTTIPPGAAGKKATYWWRCIRIERVGDVTYAMVMLVRLEEPPGRYYEAPNARALQAHLKVLRSFTVEPKEKK